MRDGHSPERWQQIKHVFDRVRNCDPDGRAAYLAEISKNDDALRREVEALLSADGRAGNFLETPIPLGAAEPITPPMPAKVGHYRVLSKIGEGGMGIVYSAEDTRLGRNVAIKMIREPSHPVMRERLWR